MLLNGDLPTEDFHLISSCPCWAYTSVTTGTTSITTLNRLPVLRALCAFLKYQI